MLVSYTDTHIFFPKVSVLHIMIIIVIKVFALLQHGSIRPKSNLLSSLYLYIDKLMKRGCVTFRLRLDDCESLDHPIEIG